MIDMVNIRHFQPESDAKQVHDLWINGLEQTIKSKSWVFRPIWKIFFHIMACNAVASNGDVGPNGQNLFSHWCEDKENRCLLVGEKKCLGTNAEECKIVGCIAVIRGTDSRVEAKFTEEQSTFFSVWKMSVAEECRRHGIGSKLLEAGEKWAADNGCKKMKIVTANPIASQFYQNQGYKPIDSNILFAWLGGWHEKEIQKF